MDRWNVSSVIDFSSMFAGAEAYNAAEYGIENWDTSAATDMSLMVRRSVRRACQRSLTMRSHSL
jgi:Mycoplasma protein of unknown function, DUF285